MNERPAARRALLAAWCALLADPGRAQGGARVWLRIRNDSHEPFEQVWQGLPTHGTAVELGPLAPGQTSRWHALPAEPAAHYRKTRIQLARRQIIHVNDGAYPDGRATLAANHRYTLAYALTDRGLALTVIEEGTRPPDTASQS